MTYPFRETMREDPPKKKTKPKRVIGLGTTY